jgi:dipeptidyl aminopeptidase/acylaminoacyl peptidase
MGRKSREIDALKRNSCRYQFFVTLQRLNVPSKMLYFPDVDHWVLKPQNPQFWCKIMND